MKSITIHILLFISAIIGASFSFWYLIDHHIYHPQLSSIAPYVYFLNHGLFILALLLMIYTFFMKPRKYKRVAFLIILMGLSYILIILSFIEPKYLYLIPLGFYFLTGFYILQSVKNNQKR